MKNVITGLSICGILAFASLAFAQVPALPDQVVAAGGQFDQASTPAATGFVAYGKKISASAYSYTRISETSITLKKAPQIETKTETGACVYTATIFGFHSFTCGTIGIATAAGTAGFSASPFALFTRAIGKKGVFIGGTGGASYSAITGKTTYPVGALLGYAK